MGLHNITFVGLSNGLLRLHATLAPHCLRKKHPWVKNLHGMDRHCNIKDHFVTTHLLYCLIMKRSLFAW
jgi:hypothetical protein